ncbi:MAG: hypothetical protein E6G81_10575 [Alphaproteobacteria bacterium]|nr:MAG: hypothetical protein E6G81_10575 [Alphaproteobacteria bacterium]
MGNDLRMIATNVALLVRSLQSCCDNTDTAPFIADLAAIGNDINGTVSAIWPATASSLSAPAENQILQFAVDVNDLIDTLDRMAALKPLPDPIAATATTVLGAVLALLRPIEVAHNLAVKPGAPPPPSRPALVTIATPLRSRSIRAAAERHAATLNPERARAELAAVRFPA